MGGPNNTYLWQANGTELVGETLQILVLPNVTASTGGMYTCVVSNQAGNDSASTSVFVYPYFVSQPRDVVVSVGSSAMLICVVESFPNPAYQWQRMDGRPIHGGVSTIGRNLTISSIQYGDEGEYYCNASANGQTIVSEVGVIIGRLQSDIIIMSLKNPVREAFLCGF